MSIDNLSLLYGQQPAFGQLTARGVQQTPTQVQPQKVQPQETQKTPQVQPGLLNTEDYETAQAVIDSGIDFSALLEEASAQQEEKLGFDFSNLIQFQKDDGEIHPFNEKNLYVA